MDPEDRRDAIEAGRGVLALAIKKPSAAEKKQKLKFLKMTLTALGAITPAIVQSVQEIEGLLDANNINQADEKIASLAQNLESLIPQ